MSPFYYYTLALYSRVAVTVFVYEYIFFWPHVAYIPMLGVFLTIALQMTVVLHEFIVRLEEKHNELKNQHKKWIQYTLMAEGAFAFLTFLYLVAHLTLPDLLKMFDVKYTLFSPVPSIVCSIIVFLAFIVIDVAMLYMTRNGITEATAATAASDAVPVSTNVAILYILGLEGVYYALYLISAMSLGPVGSFYHLIGDAIVLGIVVHNFIARFSKDDVVYTAGRENKMTYILPGVATVCALLSLIIFFSLGPFPPEYIHNTVCLSFIRVFLLGFAFVRFVYSLIPFIAHANDAVQEQSARYNDVEKNATFKKGEKSKFVY